MNEACDLLGIAKIEIKKQDFYGDLDEMMDKQVFVYENDYNLKF